MANSFTCTVVTPEAKLLEHEAVYASVPAWDGLFGVMPGRAPLVARLGIGELLVRMPDERGGTAERSYFVRHGFVKMSEGGLTVIAEQATPAEDLIEADAKAELAEAEARALPSGDADERTKARQRLQDDVRAARVKARLAQGVKSKGI